MPSSGAFALRAGLGGFYFDLVRSGSYLVSGCSQGGRIEQGRETHLFIVQDEPLAYDETVEVGPCVFEGDEAEAFGAAGFAVEHYRCVDDLPGRIVVSATVTAKVTWFVSPHGDTKARKLENTETTGEMQRTFPYPAKNAFIVSGVVEWLSPPTKYRVLRRCSSRGIARLGSI